MYASVHTLECNFPPPPTNTPLPLPTPPPPTNTPPPASATIRVPASELLVCCCHPQRNSETSWFRGDSGTERAPALWKDLGKTTQESVFIFGKGSSEDNSANQQIFSGGAPWLQLCQLEPYLPTSHWQQSTDKPPDHFCCWFAAAEQMKEEIGVLVSQQWPNEPKK